MRGFKFELSVSEDGGTTYEVVSEADSVRAFDAQIASFEERGLRWCIASDDPFVTVPTCTTHKRVTNLARVRRGIIKCAVCGTPVTTGCQCISNGKDHRP